MATAIIIILASLIAVLEILHHKERKDLYNRIMSKDLNEYRNINKKPRRPVSKHERMLAKWRGASEE